MNLVVSLVFFTLLDRVLHESFTRDKYRALDFTLPSHNRTSWSRLLYLYPTEF